MFFKFGKSAKPAAVKPPKQFDASVKIERRPVFAVGTGRCGTHFLEAIMREDPSILALHTDRVNAEADSFLRYGLWYKLPIDLEPARDFRRRLILSAQEEGRSYFEANAYMAVASAELHQWYGANLIQLVRRPQDVVNSHLVKGWYDEAYPRGDAALLPGFPPEMIANHFFGRILPLGEEYKRWSALTRVGKVSWWINALNIRILDTLAKLPQEHVRVVKLEELDYDKYLDLHRLANGKSPMTRARFDEIRAARPGKGKSTRHSSDWNDAEWQEFMTETKPLHERVNYEPKRSR